MERPQGSTSGFTPRPPLHLPLLLVAHPLVYFASAQSYTINFQRESMIDTLKLFPELFLLILSDHYFVDIN